MARRHALSCAIAVLLVSACGDEGLPAPEAGTLTVVVVSPAGAEGAALIEVAGAVSGPTMPAGQAFARPAGSATRIAMVREAAGELRVVFDVPDIHRPPNLHLLQVAGPDDQLRNDLSAYRLEVVR